MGIVTAVIMPLFLFSMFICVFFPESQIAGRFHCYQLFVVQTLKHILHPVFHSGAAVQEQIGFLQVF